MVEADHYMRDLVDLSRQLSHVYDLNTAEAADMYLGVDAMPAGRNRSSGLLVSRAVCAYVGQDVSVDEVVGPRARERGLRSLLHLALEHRFQGIARLLIEWGVDPNDSDERQRRPLHTAAAAGNDWEVVCLLLEHGADPFAVHCSGRTMLHFAAEGRGSILEDGVLVELLVVAGLDVNAAECVHGNTPLHLAAKKGSVAVCTVLVSRGADVNARNRERSTPVHQGAWNLTLLKLLLEYGGDLRATDAWGRTPLQTIQNRDPTFDASDYIIRLLVKEKELTGIPMDKANSEFIDGTPICQRERDKCNVEIEEMKWVRRRGLSIHNLFTWSVEELTKRMQNDTRLAKQLAQMDFYRMFPVYASDLREKLQKVYEARKHAHRVVGFLNASLGDCLPQHILENIGQYLTQPEDVKFR